MAIVVGLDVHRAQIAYDALNTATGEVATGRITPADRPTLRGFLRRWAGEDVGAAVEATTGWRFVVEELQRAGARVQLAEPADTTAARGPKRRAKTDKRDARHLRDLRSSGGCRRPGSRPNTSSSYAPWCGCARRSSTSAPSGCSASTPCSSITASASRSAGSMAATPTRRLPRWTSRRPRNARSPSRWRSSSTSTPSSPRSTTTSRPSRALSPAAGR